MRGVGEGVKVVIAIVLEVLALYWILPLFMKSGGSAVSGGAGGGSGTGPSLQFSKVFAPIPSSSLGTLGLNPSGPGGAGVGIPQTLKSFLNDLGVTQWPALDSSGSSTGAVMTDMQGNVMGVSVGPA